MNFICPRCGESDERYIGYKNNVPYCRRCISFIGENATYVQNNVTENALELNYSLTKEQRRISTRITKNYIEGTSTLIKAVCGAGKTELVYGVINYALSRGHRIGFAIPRKDVVIELEDRIRKAFPKNHVVSIYGGHHEILTADIVILTTHQIYRYEQYFDLLIMDEVDAFPFSNNNMLLRLSSNSVKGTLVMMSATPEPSLLKLFNQPNHEILELNTRYHGHALPVPEIVVKLGFLKYEYLRKKLTVFKLEHKPVLIFVPTISDCETLYKKLKRDGFEKGNYVHSKRRNREQIIKDFKFNKYQFLVTTAVLERGVTIKNLQVIIYDSDSPIYNTSSLIQISGRVGRKYDAPKGEVIFLSSHISDEMAEAKQRIIDKNLFL